MPTTHIPLRPLTLAVLFALLLPVGLYAQTEAASSQEILEFQHKERPKRKVLIQKQDYIIYPTPESNYLREEKGEIVGWGDSTITVKEKITGEMVDVDMNKTPYIRKFKRGRLIGGWVLVGLGIAYSALVLTFAMIAIASGAIPGLFGLLIFVGIFLNPTNYIFFGIGIPLILTARKKLNRFDWTWRRIRQVFVKKKAG